MKYVFIEKANLFLEFLVPYSDKIEIYMLITELVTFYFLEVI